MNKFSCSWLGDHNQLANTVINTAIPIHDPSMHKLKVQLWSCFLFVPLESLAESDHFVCLIFPEPLKKYYKLECVIQLRREISAWNTIFLFRLPVCIYELYLLGTCSLHAQGNHPITIRRKNKLICKSDVILKIGIGWIFRFHCLNLRFAKLIACFIWKIEFDAKDHEHQWILPLKGHQIDFYVVIWAVHFILVQHLFKIV